MRIAESVAQPGSLEAGSRTGSLDGSIERGSRWIPSHVGIAVFIGYYVGAKLGLVLTFPPNPISVLWPPNAILFAALLLVPRRQWWVAIAAAFPAHLLAELQGGVPATMVFCWFVSNVTEAVIGATCVQFLGGGSRPFARPLHVVGFVLAAFTAALLSSFLDAAFVIFNGWGGADYWSLWSSRLLSNTTASLVLVPAIVTFATGGLAAMRRPDPARFFEAAVLLMCLVGLAFNVFDSKLGPYALPVGICMPLPLLLWAAYRFGPPGISAAMAITAVIAILGSGQGIGALGAGTPEENVRAVQMFLLVLSPTLLCFAAAMEERRRAEALLRQSDKRFHVMLEATRDTVYERDVGTDAMWWNRNALTPFGYAGAGTEGAIPAWPDLIHPDDRVAALREQREAIAGSDRRWETEFRVLRANGTFAQVIENGYIVRDTGGRPLQVIGRITDVTERRDADELSNKLAHASRLTIMGELTASIAHEISQPMSAILTNVDAAQMLLDRGDYSVAELRGILQDIRSDDLRAREVIGHLRGLATKRGAELESLGTNELIRAILPMVARAARQRGVVINTAYSEVPRVRGDRIHVQQVLLNLVFNGMDSMADTPIKRRELSIGTSRGEGNTVMVWVRDRGTGIAPQAMEQIFDSFFTTKAGGMGLGLSLSRTLVQAHGGRIWAENNPDGGATLRFTLRVDRGDPVRDKGAA